MEQSTSRLRKAFRYPTDDNSDGSVAEALDEEEQESVIASLRLHNETQNKIFTQFLFTIPFLSLFPYLAIPFYDTPSNTILLAVLSISSLLSTAWMVYILPSESIGIDFIDNIGSRAERAQGLTTDSGRREALLSNYHGPIRKHLPLLNMGLSLLLLGLSILGRRREVMGAGTSWWLLGCLPATIYAIILVGKRVMGSVDPGELDGLRYQLKGA